MNDLHSPDAAIVVTGGDTGCGEVVRGDVLHIDWDEADDNAEYALEAYADALWVAAPQEILDGLYEIIEEHRQEKA